MSGERELSNQNSDVIPDAGDTAVHTAQPRSEADHVFVPCAVCFCAQIKTLKEERKSLQRHKNVVNPPVILGDILTDR